MQETRKTDKGYKISVGYSDYPYRDVEDFFGEGYEFRYGDPMKYASTEGVKNISEEIIFKALGFNDLYDYDQEDNEYYIEQAEKLKEKYYIYPISVYEHSLFAFHLLYDDKLYSNDGVLFLDKEFWEGSEWAKDEKQIDKRLRNDYTDFFNGSIYRIDIFKPHKRKDEDDEELTTWDYVDGLGGFFRNDINEGYADYFEETYGKLETDF